MSSLVESSPVYPVYQMRPQEGERFACVVHRSIYSIRNGAWNIVGVNEYY